LSSASNCDERHIARTWLHGIQQIHTIKADRDQPDGVVLKAISPSPKVDGQALAVKIPGTIRRARLWVARGQRKVFLRQNRLAPGVQCAENGGQPPMMFCRRQSVVLCLILVGLAGSLGAATNSAWVARAWYSEDGLPEHTIVGLAQTPDGYLWVATHQSLTRFDGVRFQEFTPAMTVEPRGGQIRAMLLDRRGRLWLAKDFGTVLCVEAGLITQVIRVPEASVGTPSRTLAEDAEGNIWMSDNTGSVCRIQAGKILTYGTSDGLPGGGICWLTTDEQGQFWFSQEGSVGCFRNGRFETVVTVAGPSPRIAPARNGGLWLCSGVKLFYHRAGAALETVAELKFAPGRTPSVITALYEDTANGLWLGTASSGLFRYEAPSLQNVATSHPNILNIAEDSEGNLWVSTRGGGLNRLSPRAVQVAGLASGLPFAAVFSACEDAAGNLWAVGQNGALARRDQNGWRQVTSADGWTGGDAACVLEVGGAVRIGTRANGVFRHERGVFVAEPFNQQLPNHTIRSLYANAAGDLWIAINSGIARQRRSDGEFKYFPLPAGVSNVRTLVEDAAGDLWMGTTSDGQLLRIRQDTLLNETTNIMGGPQHIRCLQVTTDGSLWFGFVGQGLGWLKNGRYFQFHAEDGLWDEYISQILPDERGRLWLAGNRGIFHVSRSELEAVAQGRMPQLRSVIFGRGEGVPNLQASFGISPSGVRTRSGQLLMPMLSGVAIVDPQRLRENPQPPPVIIERLTVNGRVAAVFDIAGRPEAGTAPVNLRNSSTQLKFGPGVNRMEFAFTGLSLASPENVTFRYQLVGLDQDWVNAGAARVARYPRIPPGEYHFRVIACNHDGIWNDIGDSIQFTVRPHLLEATWFQVTATTTAFVLLGGGLLLGMRWRYRRKLERLQQEKALERERTRIAQDLHDDLGAGLVEINFGSELAQDPTLGAEEVREHSREIGARAKEMVTALDEIVWAVNPKHDSVSSLATYFCQFAQHFLKATPVRCHLEVETDLPAAPLNSEQRHSLFLAFKEALSNVVQHAGATDLHLAIGTGAGMLTITLRDNGCGFDRAAPRERSSADGLGNMQRRLQQLGGQYQLTSQPGQGVTVCFKVPLAAPASAGGQ
jgi:signal transduction histidine kinase/ligand-binding sensor domain-containing protein